MNSPSDNKIDFNEALKQIEDWKKCNNYKISLKDIEALMCKKLGVEPLSPEKKIEQRYCHPVIEDMRLGSKGLFTVHMLHEQINKRWISKRDYIKFLYKPLLWIVNYLKEQKNV